MNVLLFCCREAPVERVVVQIALKWILFTQFVFYAGETLTTAIYYDKSGGDLHFA